MALRRDSGSAAEVLCNGTWDYWREVGFDFPGQADLIRTMADVKNLEASFAKFETTWSPQVVGELNGQHVKLVKLEGDKCPWHAHEHEDEMFLVIEGRLEIQLRDRGLVLGPNDFFIVPRGVEHRVVPLVRTKVLLFEPKGIAHTGKVQSEITKTDYEVLN